jgi:hypothetical protein
MLKRHREQAITVDRGSHGDELCVQQVYFPQAPKRLHDWPPDDLC